jgi:branched-chain amino acid transport system ATP-binding protein
MSALETQLMCKNFGALAVANKIDFKLEPGARHALIGPNGAGKTTFINLLTGRLSPSSGKVMLAGDDVTGLSQSGRVKRGLGRTFQINTLFRGLSVLENVFLAVCEREGIGNSILRRANARKDLLEESYALLESLHIGDDALITVRELPYGKLRLVELAIALGLKPKVLLLDEPAAGLPSSETAIVFDTVQQLPKDIAILIIEHDMDLVFRLANRITVLVQGTVLTEGTPDEIQHDARVREVYLGERDHG